MRDAGGGGELAVVQGETGGGGEVALADRPAGGGELAVVPGEAAALSDGDREPRARKEP